MYFPFYHFNSFSLLRIFIFLQRKISISSWELWVVVIELNDFLIIHLILLFLCLFKGEKFCFLKDFCCSKWLYLIRRDQFQVVFEELLLFIILNWRIVCFTVYLVYANEGWVYFCLKFLSNLRFIRDLIWITQ